MSLPEPFLPADENNRQMADQRNGTMNKCPEDITNCGSNLPAFA